MNFSPNKKTYTLRVFSALAEFDFEKKLPAMNARTPMSTKASVSVDGNGPLFRKGRHIGWMRWPGSRMIIQ